jgi:hypothetical protein
VKKILALALALVLCFAVSAFAIQAEIPADTTAAIAKGGTQVTIGGELRFRGASYSNVGDFNKGSTGASTTFGTSERMVYESRVRLSVEARTSPNTIGFIQLEGTNGTVNGENYNWGSNGALKTNGGTFRQGDVKQNGMEIRQAWLQHSGSGLIGVPAYIKVGHQPVTIGAGVFLKHDQFGDDAIIVGITPIKGLDLSAITIKLLEGTAMASDDITVYAGVLSYAINKDIVIGGDVSYLQMQNQGGTTNNGSQKIDLWNLGVNAKAKVSGFSLKGSFDMQFGNERIFGVANQAFRGYAGTLGAAYTFAPVTLGLDLGYGSGDKKQDNKLSTFMTSQAHLQSQQPGTFVYTYLTANAAGNYSGGLQNTMYARLSANAEVVKDFTLGGSIAFLSAAQKVYGGGTPLTAIAEAAPNTVSSKYIGTEFDINLAYQIDKGLKYFVEGGYLFAGRFFKDATLASRTVGGNTFKFSDPWGIRHGLQLNF